MMISSHYATNQELAQIWGMKTARGADLKAEREGFPSKLIEAPEGVRSRGGKLKVYSLRYLPAEIKNQIKTLRARGNLPQTVEEQGLAELPEWKRDKAYDRLTLLEKLSEAFDDPSHIGMSRTAVVQKFSAQYNKGKIDRELLNRVGPRSWRSILRWANAYEEADGDATALAPAYGKTKGQFFKLPDIARQFIRNLYLFGNADGSVQRRNLFNLGQNLRSIKWVYYKYSEQMRAAIAAGHAGEGEIASYSTVVRFISTISELEKDLARKGKKFFENKSLPYMEREYDSILANDVWNSDGHVMNIVCRNERGDLLRPTLTGWEDVSSRKFLGYVLEEVENTETVARSLKRSISGNGYMRPRRVLLDNGKAYKNKQILGLMARLGTRVEFANPYNAKAKPIEPLWFMVDEYVSKDFRTYCGKDIDRKPEKLKEILKLAKEHPELVPTLDEVRERLDEFMLWYNGERPHTGRGMNNRTPDNVYAYEADELITVDEREFGLLFYQRYERVVGQQGIKFQNWWYQDSAGQFELYRKRSVEIAVDQDDLNRVFVFDEDGRYLFTANRTELASWAPESRAQNQEQYKRVKRLKKTGRKFAKGFRDIQSEIDDFANTLDGQVVPDALPGSHERDISLPSGLLDDGDDEEE